MVRLSRWSGAAGNVYQVSFHLCEAHLHFRPLLPLGVPELSFSVFLTEASVLQMGTLRPTEVRLHRVT